MGMRNDALRLLTLFDWHAPFAQPIAIVIASFQKFQLP